MANLYEAHRQWAFRPTDERLHSIDEVITRLEARQGCTREVHHVAYGRLHMSYGAGDIVLSGPNGNPVDLTHYSFGQVASLAGVPAGWARPTAARDDDGAQLVVAALNDGLAWRQARVEAGNAIEPYGKVLLTRVGTDGAVLRALTTSGYTRVWDLELARMFQTLRDRHGFINPPARPAEGDTFPCDADGMVPSGLYVGERDCFFFMTNEALAFDIGGKSFKPGIMAWNSEVGMRSIGMLTFLYDYVCGNHIVWNAKDVTEIICRHVGRVGEKFRQGFLAAVGAYASRGTWAERAAIRAAMEHYVASDAAGAVAFLRRFDVGKKDAESVVTLVERESPQRIGTGSQDPTNLFNLVGGITWHSQTMPNADDRVALDKIAGKMLVSVRS